MCIREEFNTSFEKIRSQCLENKILVALNFKKQFRAVTDAASGGKGVHIYQLKDPSKCEFLEADLDPSNRDTIMYYQRPGQLACWTTPHTMKRQVH